MYQLQMQIFSAMIDTASNYADACSSIIEAHSESLAASLTESSAKTKPAEDTAATEMPASKTTTHENERASYTMPELPKAGQSWYSAPHENPVLAFWDQMLRPWRTYTPAVGASFGQQVWPGMGPDVGAGTGYDFCGQRAMSAMPWMLPWSAMISAAAQNQTSI